MGKGYKQFNKKEKYKIFVFNSFDIIFYLIRMAN